MARAATRAVVHTTSTASSTHTCRKRFLQTESKNIIVTSAANKVPGSLSLGLDGTLKSGHNMRVFATGTAAALANRGRYGRFTRSMHAAYSAMESELDSSSSDGAVAAFWKEYGAVLRREPSLRADLADVNILVTAEAEGFDEHAEQLSPATYRYVQSIRVAGAADRKDGGARLLGHVYCRYFADLFGGSMLQSPTRWALDLPADTPRHYAFELPIERKGFIENIYTSLNVVGESLPTEQFADVVAESTLVFKLNADVYSEEPMMVDALVGSFNVAKGYATASS